MNGLLEKALVVAQEEAKEIQKIIDREENTFRLEPSDWWYYAEKIKKSKYSFDETELRQYFQLDSVLGGLFSVANRLYGIQFEKTEDVPIPHPDAIAFKVTEADGALIGILYMDFFPRESKRAGAWMSSYRKQCRKDDISIVPLITMVCNFTKPTESTPALLSFEEVSTLFHEFGHALHGLLSNCTYKSLSGTAVARDFVELPSQIMENWVAEPEVLKSFAKHYLTGETISDDLIAKLNNSSQFNQGFETSELLAAAVLDMDYHTIEDTSGLDITEFENRSLEKMKLIPEIVVRYRSTYFNHIFSGGYSAGYYSYIWAEILDADAFALFKEKGIFDQETAASFRENILERGATEDPMSLYMKFRGAEPDVQYLINKRGLQ